MRKYWEKKRGKILKKKKKEENEDGFFSCKNSTVHYNLKKEYQCKLVDCGTWYYVHTTNYLK